MKFSNGKSSGGVAGVMMAALLLGGCGSDSSSTNDVAAQTAAAAAPTAGTPTAATPTGATTASVPDNTGDSPSLFMAFVKSMAAGNDETSEAMSMPAALKDSMADDTGEPKAVGS